MVRPSEPPGRPSPRTRAIALLVAVGAALAAFTVRGREGVARTVDPVTEGVVLAEPAALYRAVRVARAVEDHGWVTSRETGLAEPRDGALAEAAGEADEGASIPWGPGYELALAVVHRRALPSLDHLMAAADARAPEPAPGGAERARIEALVAGAPPVLGALTALVAALLAHLLVRALGAPGAGAALAAGAAGLGVAFPWAHVEATARGSGSAAGWTGLMLTASVAVVAAGWRARPVQQPFPSSLRGALAGLFAGLALAADGRALAAVLLVQLAFFVRLLVPFRGADGGHLPARAFPVFVTSFHKVALLSVLPVMIENPFTAEEPFGIRGCTWLHFACLAVGWLAFAPLALAPRLVAPRPVLALLPAAAVALFVGLSTGALAALGELVGVGGDPAAEAAVLGPWFLGVPPAAWVLGVRARRAPELVPVVILGAGLPVLALAGSLELAWAVPAASVLVAVALAPAMVGLRSPLAAVAAAALLALAAFHPRTLEPADRSDEAAHGAAVAEALVGLGDAVRAEGAGERVLGPPELGAAVLWRAGLRPAAVALDGPERPMGQAAFDGVPGLWDPQRLVPEAQRLGYDWLLVPGPTAVLGDARLVRSVASAGGGRLGIYALPGAD